MATKMSEKVVFAKLSILEAKAMVTRTKLKLKECNIFIENDLCYEDQNVQEQIAKWVRDKNRQVKT